MTINGVMPMILAGGRGARLWPASNRLMPKQFAKSFGSYSLLQRALINNSIFGKPLVVVTHNYFNLLKVNLSAVSINADVIVEPFSKDTGASVLIGALFAKMRGEGVIVIVPSDHMIVDFASYFETINDALCLAKLWGKCMIGVKMEKPSSMQEYNAYSAYGYIKARHAKGSANALSKNGLFVVDSFREKPAASEVLSYAAMNMLKGGDNYFWNSGIAAFDIDFLLEQAKIHQPKMLSLAQLAFEDAIACSSIAKYTKYTTAPTTATKNNRSINISNISSVSAVRSLSTLNSVIRLDVEHYLKMQSISIDYALMQNMKNVYMKLGNFFWKDLGSWDSIWQISKKDANQNCFKGNVFNIDVKSSYINGYKDKLVGIIGLKNLVVVDTEDALLIMDRSSAQKVKDLVKMLEKDKNRCKGA